VTGTFNTKETTFLVMFLPPYENAVGVLNKVRCPLAGWIVTGTFNNTK
jgi:hypothetical protein